MVSFRSNRPPLPITSTPDDVWKEFDQKRKTTEEGFDLGEAG